MSLVGVKVLLEGASGTGKTHSIQTLVQAGLEVFIIATDNGVETLGKFTKEVLEHIHWRYIPPLKPSWETLKATGKIINISTNDALQKSVDPGRGQYTQILDVVDFCGNFIDHRGKEWGSIDSWDTTRVLVFDNLSGMNLMCRTLAVGAKPVLTQPDWGVCMDYQLKFIQMLTGINTHFVLISHIERELIEAEGVMKISASALGRKNAPALPAMFSDVILAHREGQQYFWSVTNTQADLKTRNLLPGDKMPPTFVPLINTWKNSSSIME